MNRVKPQSKSKQTSKVAKVAKKAKAVKTTLKRNIRLTRVTRGGHHATHDHTLPTNAHHNKRSDQWYNPDEDSDFSEHHEGPPPGVFAFPHASTPYKAKMRFGHEPDVAHDITIYEGETFYDCAARHGLTFPDVQCLPESQLLQEDQFFDGPMGCGGCIGFFPVGYVDKLPTMTQNETQKVRRFWNFRVHEFKTHRDGGKVDGIRFLCTMNFTPALEGVEVFCPGTPYPFPNSPQTFGNPHAGNII